MIQALAIWQTVKALAKRIPWQVYLALGISLAIWAWGAHNYRSGYSEGRESVLSELRTAEAEAKEKALKAITEAGEAGVARAERFEAEQQALGEAIERAEAAIRNALDAIF
jgi:hypothetical protein